MTSPCVLSHHQEQKGEFSTVRYFETERVAMSTTLQYVVIINYSTLLFLISSCAQVIS